MLLPILLSSIGFSIPGLCVAIEHSRDVTAPRADTPLGTVYGQTTKASVNGSTSNVNTYLGIPYASPPTRFDPPVGPKPWTTPLQATSYSPACYQAIPNGFEYNVFVRAQYPESEDCLYLNVFTPSEATSNGNRSVMFWIHGGNLVYGSANAPYDGSYLAGNHDVVVVTINYRTNVFGFPNAPSLEQGQQNLGFLDQRKALQWTVDNIAAFGGDPTKITIFGESAGGYSVKQLLAHPPSPLPFRAAIIESQQLEGAFKPADSSTVDWERLVSALGCSLDADQLECVRRANAAFVRDTVVKNQLLFNPAVDNETNSQFFSDSLRLGQVARVPILVGSNKDDGSYIVGLVGGTVAGVLDKFFPGNAAAQSAISAALTGLFGLRGLANLVATQIAFGCPTSSIAKSAKTGGYSIWRYYYAAVFQNTQYFVDAGAYHTSEIPEVFGTYPRAGSTAEQAQLSQYMQKTWSDFAKNPSSGPGWVTYDDSQNTLQEIGGSNSTGGKLISPAEVDVLCSVISPILETLGIA